MLFQYLLSYICSNSNITYREYKQMDINHHLTQYQQYQSNSLRSTRQSQRRRRRRRREQNNQQVNTHPQPIAVRHTQRSDRGVANSTNNQRIVYRAQERPEIHQQNSTEQVGKNLESLQYNRHIENQHTRQFEKQPNNSVSNPPEDPQEPADSNLVQASEYGSLFEMSEINFDFEQEFDIQKFILQNTIGECAKYRLPKRNIRIDDRFISRTRYQYVLRQLVKFEIIADVNRRMEQKDEEIYQRQIKVKLAQHLIFNQKSGYYQKKVILKAANTRNYYYLEQTLIKGKRLGIMTRSLPFKTDNLIAKIGETRLCFIWKDYKTKNILVKGLDSLEIGYPQEQNLLYYNEEKENYQKLQHDEYFFMDLDSVISSVRQYKAVLSSPNFPLIQQIIGKSEIRGTRQQERERRGYLVGNKIFNSIRTNRNRSQLSAIQNIFSQQKGIYLIQGPPGTGKTQTIVNFISLQQQYFSLKKDDQCTKIMICAQSNAAVNHIGRKILTDKLIGRQQMPCILRLGHTQQFDELLLSINLPHLCQIKLRGTENNRDDWSAKLRWEKLVLQAKINKMMKEGYQKNQIRREKDQLYYKIKRLVQIHVDLQSQQIKYNQIQIQYLNQSQIVLTTLNTSGKKKFADFYCHKIRCLIIDEASQATQPSTLIPFMTNVQKIILVGDHMQLQPTVMSTNCRFTNYNRSLFQRLVSINRIPYLLNMQYRMVPTLQQFPSKQFYEGRLKLGKKIIVPYSLGELSSSSMFFNVNYGKEEKLKKSYQNQAEAYCVSILIGRLMYYDSSLKIGVIAPYKSQIKHLESQILEVPMSDQERDNLKISTVDAFQGQQMDVIIISCVRSNPQRTIGFVRDQKRMNVAITRAKYALFVFGNANTLTIDGTWRDYIAHHRTKNSFYDIKSQNECDPQIRRLVKLRRQNQQH